MNNDDDARFDAQRSADDDGSGPFQGQGSGRGEGSGPAQGSGPTDGPPSAGPPAGATASPWWTAPPPQAGPGWGGAGGTGGPADTAVLAGGAGARGRRVGRIGPLAGLAAVAVLGGVVGGAGVYAATGHSSSGGTAVSTVPVVANGQPVANVTTALAKIEKSVVIINDTLTTTGSSPFNFFGGGGQQQESAAGTGMVLTAGGEVLTNAHVVNGATSIQVSIPGHGTHSARVLGLNATQDVAVIQVSGVSGLTPATFANSAQVQVGDSVLAVGNAEGYGGAPSVAEGIISATDRTLQDQTDNISGVLQTDAAINPGDSGGPLVDTAGDVVGMDTAVATGSSSDPVQGIGFAIPADTILKEIPAVLKAGTGATSGSQTSGTSAGGFLGVEVQSAQGGAVIEQVVPGSPANQAGLQPGDEITSVDGTAVSGAASLAKAVQSHAPGTTVTLVVVPAGSTRGQQVRATLGSVSSSGFGG